VNPKTAQRSDLRRLDLFAGVEDATLAALVDGVPEVRLSPGDDFDIAATAASCCLVRAGRLALGFAGADAKPRTVTLVEEGDVLVRPTATWAAVGPGMRCTAIEPSEVLLVERERLEAWMREPVLAANLAQVLSAEVADRELAVAIALEPRVERRLLLKLQQLAERWGRVTPRGVRLDLRLTHQELADMVGCARESVTIALGNLAREGHLTVRNRTILMRSRPEAERADPPG
jgi:CRP/FNR family transcriptional regulator, cyclic AMP receptor protein